MAEPVTILVRRRVKPGQEAAYEAWLTRLTEGAGRDFPGYLGSEFHRPASSGAEYRSLFRFDRLEALERFEASDFRAAMLAEVAPLVAGDAVMTGYWQNPDATAEAIRNGWLWTGDIGTMDEDGFLTLKDRSRDVIISGGSNIYPREVEEALLTQGSVHEVAVVGAPHPEWGEEVVAFIVTAPNRTVDAGTLDAHCLAHIARFKRPKRYVFVESLPKNNYGKVLKTELRERLRNEGADAVGRPR